LGERSSKNRANDHRVLVVDVVREPSVVGTQ